MHFDARRAKLLKPGEHIIVEDCPGLRLEVSSTRRTWTYRYKSPVDERMRQIGFGQWPAMSPAAAGVEWERLRGLRDSGVDPAKQKRAARAVPKTVDTANKSYPVRQLVADYLDEHIDAHRAPKGQKEVRRLLESELASIDDVEAEKLTRAQAFDLLQGMSARPVLASQVRGELGAAWDHALDAGRISENSPNWWRLIMRGKLRSKGKKISGKHIGTEKRALAEPHVGALINWLPNFSKLVADSLTMYLWTGTRGSEIVAMEPHELHREEDGILWWTVPKRKTKNARHEHATDLRVPSSVAQNRLRCGV